MTINDYMNEMRKLDSVMRSPTGQVYSEMMSQQQEIWSNAAAKGYAIRAAQGIGLTEQQIKELLKELHYVFDVMTVSEAEQLYNDF